MGSIAQELKDQIAGEVHFDAYTRALYSTDASIYRVPPLGVVAPRRAADLAAVVALAARERIPLLPRGAGTSLAGQTIGRALILDCSRYLNHVLEINAEEGWVRVQPGVVLDQLNETLRPHGLMFGPDVATSSRACLGGMIGNNSSGARSIIYGKTGDHLLALKVLLADGSEAEFGPNAVPRQGGLEGELYREIPRIIAAHRDEIRRRFPKIQRRVSGYNLDTLERMLAQGAFPDLAQLVCGSEGTLAIVTEAKLHIVPRPKRIVLGVLAFDDLIAALEATVALIETGPAAIELVDRMILDLTKDSQEFSRDKLPVSGEPEALLLVEYRGDSEAEVNGKLERLASVMKRQFPRAECVLVPDPAKQANVWKIRKAGVGILLSMRSGRKPIAFVEDTAVDPQHLPEYARRFREIVTRHGTTAGYYGHASVGCLHLRPLIDINDPADVERMKAIASEVSDLVAEFGGAMTGEHGDGMLRSLWLEKLFGPDLVQAFGEVKRLFDPQGILNPGKITAAPPMDENLRSQGLKPLPLQTHLSFAREGGMLAALNQCSGVGICRKRDTGVMCPSYMATGDERYSTRGRANALRAVLQGELPADELGGEGLHDSMTHCLACKGCKTECPSSVDMARLKVEYLAHYYARHGTPLQATVMGNIDLLSILGSCTAPLANPILNSRPVRLLMQKILGIDARRPLPPFAARTLKQRFAAQRLKAGSPLPQSPRLVALFVDTFVNHNCPPVGEAAMAILERAGYQVVIPDRPCCGRAALSQGLVERARGLARQNLERLWPYVEAGIPIVGLEPSCIATIRDEYLDLLDDPRAKKLGEGIFLLEEFLLREHEAGRLPQIFRNRPETVWIHGHCHQKALTGVAPAVAALRLVPELDVRVIEAGCCGMAGAFGYEHYDLSLAVGEQQLFPAVRALPEGAVLVAEGVSCRQQISHGAGREACHLAEVLRDSLAAA